MPIVDKWIRRGKEGGWKKGGKEEGKRKRGRERNEERKKVGGREGKNAGL